MPNLTNKQKQQLGDAVWGQAIKLVEFFGDDQTTEELAAAGITPSQVQEQIEKWFSHIPSQYK